MFKYVVVENKHTGYDAIKLLDDPFSGIIISYGKVEFEEDDPNDTLRLKFEYEIHDKAGKDFTDLKPFEKYLGDLLQQLIHEGLEENNLTYTGGVDDAKITKII
jgi:hypothetical protein